MIIPVPHVIQGLWQQPRRGHQVNFRNEYGYGHCTPPCIAVYNMLGEKLGYFAKGFRHSPDLHAAVSLNLIKGFVWLADKQYLLIEVVDREKECEQDFGWSWIKRGDANNSPLNN